MAGSLTIGVGDQRKEVSFDLFPSYSPCSAMSTTTILAMSSQRVPSIGTSRMQSLGRTILMQPEWRQRVSFWHIQNFTSLPVIILCPGPSRAPF